jgi:hypothetical protein
MNNDIRESAPNSERQGLIEAVTNDAIGHLGVNLSGNTPKEIVSTVNDAVTKLVFGEDLPIPNTEDPDLLLGCLWGTQMVREFEWVWVNIHRGESLDIAVASPTRDMVIYPFSFVGACIAKQCICTVALSFNMLVERRDAPVFPEGSYEDVMAHVHHIVPPYALEEES